MSPLLRSDSLTVINDPRIAQDNVINRRLTYFSTICVAAALMSTLAFTAIAIVKPTTGASETDRAGSFSYCNLLALAGLCVTMCLNLFTVVVLTHQMYIVGRMLTAGPLGFEMGKSLYLNKTITILRHLAVQAFFRSIPVFLLSVASMVYQMVCPYGEWHQRVMGGILAFVLVTSGIFTWHVYGKQRAIFREKTESLSEYEKPMHTHMGELPGPLTQRHLAFD